MVYLSDGGGSVPVAGGEDVEGPVVRVHENAGCLGAAGVERRGAASVRALDAAALQPLHPLPAVHALLQRGSGGREETSRRGLNYRGGGGGERK